MRTLPGAIVATIPHRHIASTASQVPAAVHCHIQNVRTNSDQLAKSHLAPAIIGRHRWNLFIFEAAVFFPSRCMAALPLPQ